MKAQKKLLSVFISALMLVFIYSCNKEMELEQAAGPALKSADGALSPIEELGKALFFDQNLSASGKMSCATCHAPEVGFTGPDSEINEMFAIYPGVVHTRFGNRKPPAAAYAGESPDLYYNEFDEVWIGGMFWDGRATGEVTGDPLADQAMGPFLNPLEQNAPDAKQIIDKVRLSGYAMLFEQVWGEDADWKDVEGTYQQIALAIAAYESSAEVNPFSSKYDAYLRGEVKLNKQEARGLRLFEGKAMCSACHPSEWKEGDPMPLFTDFTFDNLGTPRNPNNPFYSMPNKWNPDGTNWIDPGLGGFLKSAGYPEEVYMAEWGKHKVPTLRNVAKAPYDGFVKAYMHNGVFKSLDEVVRFYSTRDSDKADWPEPEVAMNVNTDELGDLKLTDEEINALVAFMMTLSDGYTK